MALYRLDLTGATERLLGGGVVVFPTESGYVIGCRALDPGAVARVVELKQRPRGKPLPILLPTPATLGQHMDSPLQGLADHFWPGPLTLVVPAFPGLPPSATAGTNMVGVRVSAHPITRALMERLGEPLVATSANRSGAFAAHSIQEFEGLDAVDGVLDGGALPPGANTVVGLADGDSVFFAVGALSEAEVRSAWATSRKYD